jgi:hypothetical protein
MSLTEIGVAGDGLDAGRARSLASQASLASTLGAVFFLGTRIAFGAFWLVTSVYCLLVYVPFSYFGFIQNPLLTWIPLFVNFHPMLYAVSWCAVTATLIPHLRHARTRNSAVGFIALNGLACVYVCRHPVLGTVTPDLASYFWSLVSLFPLVWLAVLDISVVDRPAQSYDRTTTTLRPTTAALAALMVSGGFALTALARAAVEKMFLPTSIAVRGIATSLSFHLLIFLGFAVTLRGIEFVGSRTSWPRQLYFALSGIFVWVLCTQALRALVFPTISFEGMQANILAASVAFAVVLYVTACAMRVQALAVPNRGAPPSATSSWVWLPLVLSLFAAAYCIPAWIGRTDWDFVLQKIAVIVTWVLALQAVCWAGVRLRGKAVLSAMLLLGCGSTVGYEYVRHKLDDSRSQAAWNSALDTYSGADISFKTAYSILARSFDNRTYRQFYEFLRQNTNLGREVSVPPADTRLVANLTPSPGEKPNVFLFVIDSLRRDSTSPYNPAVDYTPEIGRFAKDSIVLQNAFTRYGGTALSEPAIWVGAMQLHKQYIEPFYPMNNLQKLLEVDGYRSYISFDPILRTILRPTSSITELDNDTTRWGELDFVLTLKRLETAIDARVDREKPMFAYSQPQNVHTLTLQRSRIKGGRKAVTTYELRRMDAAFGEFVRFLQNRGLYDNSIIILTADHGDSYGEFGRFGHCDFLFPEIIRIPLIVHLPPRVREHLVWDVDQLAFNTDITPSLYYLLGHRPIINNELFGRPLFTKTPQEQSSYMRPQYLIASSYAPVYAILRDNGGSLFIVDAVNSKHYYYNLVDDPLGTRNHVTNQLQSENETLIRREVTLIDDFYGWHSSQSRQ